MHSKNIINKITAGLFRHPLLSTVPYEYSETDAEKIFRVILSGKLTHNTGNEIISLEREFSDYIGTKYGVATNSGTSSLHLAMKAVGIQPGDEVVVPAYTFIAVAQAVLLCGGVPIFADIDDTFALSPASIEAAITPRTKAIIVVHMFGNVADMKQIQTTAKKHKLFVIEDCAQAVGARWNGKRVGSLSDIGCFSFNEKKAIPIGQGGMLTTSNPLFYRNAIATRNTGIEMIGGKIDVTTIGSTLFMTEIQAALARRVLPHLDRLNSTRADNFHTIQNQIQVLKEHLQTYKIVQGAEPSFSRFVCMVDFRYIGISREVFIDRMRKEGIPMKTFYPLPLYKYTIFREKKDMIMQKTFPFSENTHINYRALHLPFTEQFCVQQVGMEFSPYLSHADALQIGQSIRRVFRRIEN